MRRGLAGTVFLAAVALSCVLSACSAPGAGSPAPSQTTNSASYGPTDDPLVAKLSPADRAIYEKTLAGWADVFGVVSPPVYRVIRFINPEERETVQISCLTAAGYSADEQGGIAVPPGQKQAFNDATYKCLAQYPVWPRYEKPWGRAQTEAQYEWDVRAYIPCLQKLGYTITDKPSKTVFVDTWNSTPFYPFAQVDPGVNEFDIAAKCGPQQAPGAVLYDGVDPVKWQREAGVG